MFTGCFVKCINPAYAEVLALDKVFKVTNIIPIGQGDYGLGLEGFEDSIFPETIFEIVEAPSVNAREEINKKLAHWRNEWIHAENCGDYEEEQKCKKYIDFYLDKMLLQQRFDDEAAKGAHPDDAALVALKEQG